MSSNERLGITLALTGLFWMILIIALSIEPQRGQWVIAASLVYWVGMIGFLLGGDNDSKR